MNLKNKTNLIIDILLFGGFLLAFFLNLTGLILHEWLGIVICAIAVIHLLLHNAWIKNALRRFTKLPKRPLVLFLIDAAIAFGFLGILVTGLIISTWLNLPLIDYSPWVTLHTIFAIETLFILVIKIGFHWRWINAALHRSPRPPALPNPARINSLTDNFAPSMNTTTQAKTLSRREFIAIMGVTGMAAWLALANVLKEDRIADSADPIHLSDAPDTASPTTATTTAATNSSAEIVPPTSTPIATQVTAQQPTTGSSACTVRCNRHCSYPGHCGRYYDSNNNGYCDNGECM